MAILRMKRLRLIAMRSRRDELMRELMRLGCVEVTEPDGALTDPEAAVQLTQERADVPRLKTAQNEITSALAVLGQYVSEKKKLLAPRPEVRESEFLDEEALERDIALAYQLNERESQVRRITADCARIRTEIESLMPWEPMDEVLNGAGTRTCAVALASAISQIDMSAVADAAESVTEAVKIYLVSDDETQHCFAVITLREELAAVMDAIRAIGCTQVTFPGLEGTARENIDRLRVEHRALSEQRQALIGQISAEGQNAGGLRLSADRIAAEVSKAEAIERLRGTDSVVILDGWCPAEAEAELVKTLEAFDCAWELADPAPEEYPDVPVKLKNSRLVEPMNMVTDMYALPAYDGVDPNPLMWPFFILFYGMMMADMGYGLVMMLISLIVVKKAKPRGATMRYMMPLMGLCGVSTFLFGAVTGGFFGDLLPQLAMMIDPDTTFTAMPALFSPLDDALMVLIGSLALGVVQILTGMGVSAWKKLHDGKALDAVFEEGTWFVILAGLALFVLKVTPAVLIAGGAMLLAGSVRSAVLKGGGPVKIVLGTLSGVGGSLYNNITGYFSDILSYSRLMALMLAGAVIAQVFNTLGAITGNIVTFFIISFIGNVLNFALNLLGCFVHDMRLQCLEFFGRFYEDGGKPFRPMDMTTSYVDIVKE